MSKGFYHPGTEVRDAELMKRLGCLLEATPDPAVVADNSGKILIANSEFFSVTGYKFADIVSRSIDTILKSLSGTSLDFNFNKTEKSCTINDAILLCANNSEFPAKVHWTTDQDAGLFHLFFRIGLPLGYDELLVKLFNSILSLYNPAAKRTDLINTIIDIIKKYSDCDAVGIRLEQDEDYPYVAVRGFSAEHLCSENHLCVYSSDGQKIREADGTPLLECICGRVIKGRYDSPNPFFTDGGSFWTNSITELLSTKIIEEFGTKLRNRCIPEGFESMAFIPIKGIHNNLGLLQLNDRRRNMFTSRLIKYYEEICGAIGITLMGRETGEILNKTLQQLKFHLENTPLAVISFNNNFEITEWSQKAEQIFGWTAEEVIGKNFKEFQWVYHEDAEAVESLVQEMLSGHSTSNLSINRNHRKDGTIITCEWYNSVMTDSNGTLSTVYSLVYDITSRVEAEKKVRLNEANIRSIIESIDGCIFSINSEMQLIESNFYFINSVKSYSGIVPEKGADILNFFDEDIKEEWEGYFLRGLSGEQFRIQRKSFLPDNSNIILYEFNPMLSNTGEVIGLTIVGQIITDIIEARKKLEEREKELKELNDAKDKFFSILAHDLKSPFQNMFTVTEFLVQDMENLNKNDILKFSRILYESVRKQYNLLENLLTWSLVQRNKFDFDPQLLNLNDLIDGVFRLLKSTAIRKNIELINTVHSGITVLADHRMLHSIIQNLISNSIKFTSSGGKITVSTTLSNNDITITVEDTGVGIKPEDMTSMFTLGAQHSTVGTENEKGTGLGLLLCKEFVENHGGVLSVESIEGKGSKFYFTLPGALIKRTTS